MQLKNFGVWRGAKEYQSDTSRKNIKILKKNMNDLIYKDAFGNNGFEHKKLTLVGVT